MAGQKTITKPMVRFRTVLFFEAADDEVGASKIREKQKTGNSIRNTY